MTPQLRRLSQPQHHTGTGSVLVGNGSILPITHIGSSRINHSTNSIPIHNVLCVPSLSQNLLSIQKFSHDNRCFFLLDEFGFCAKDKRTGKLLLSGPSSDELYSTASTHTPQTIKCLSARVSSSVWHRRLGHPSHPILRQALRQFSISIHGKMKNSFCNICPQGKSTHLPFHKSTTVTYNPLELLHLDVWSPGPVSSHGHLYYLSVVDDFSRFTWLFPLVKKSDVTTTFLQFKVYIENLLSSTIKTIQSDGGGEFPSKVLHQSLQRSGITHRFSCPYTAEQNGLVERKHRHIVSMGRCLLYTANVPHSY